MAFYSTKHRNEPSIGLGWIGNVLPAGMAFENIPLRASAKLSDKGGIFEIPFSWLQEISRVNRILSGTSRVLWYDPVVKEWKGYSISDNPTTILQRKDGWVAMPYWICFSGNQVRGIGEEITGSLEINALAYTESPPNLLTVNKSLLHRVWCINANGIISDTPKGPAYIPVLDARTFPRWRGSTDGVFIPFDAIKVDGGNVNVTSEFYFIYKDIRIREKPTTTASVIGARDMNAPFIPDDVAVADGYIWGHDALGWSAMGNASLVR